MSGHRRFRATIQGQQYKSEYDIPTELLDDLRYRSPSPLSVITLDLSTAGTYAVISPGRSYVPYFWQKGTTNKVRVLNGLISVSINQDDASNPSVTESNHNNQGFIGSFSKLFLSWTAQPGVMVDFVVHKSDRTPWMTDDINPTASVSPFPPSSTVVISGSTTLAITSGFILVNAAGGNIALTLPNPALWTGQFIVKKTDSSANTVTIALASGSIDLLPTSILNNQFDSNTLTSDGANVWQS